MKDCIKNMKAKNGTTKPRKIVRTTISIADDISENGHERMRQLRKRNFSIYVEDLIAADIEKNGEAVAA